MNKEEFAKRLKHGDNYCVKHDFINSFSYPYCVKCWGKEPLFKWNYAEKETVNSNEVR